MREREPKKSCKAREVGVSDPLRDPRDCGFFDSHDGDELSLSSTQEVCESLRSEDDGNDRTCACAAKLPTGIDMLADYRLTTIAEMQFDMYDHVSEEIRSKNHLGRLGKRPGVLHTKSASEVETGRVNPR